ncbi:peptidase C14, caspase catalytic subunit p20 [Rhodovulum sp. 12E13]|nr:peptidase C14, caspase catalytic subunit p20 [Rhodovulum sp. 12E13]
MGAPLRVAAAALVLALATLPALAEGRVALVIGNGSYTAVPALTNPLNDAEDISTALGDLGFDVITVTDATQAQTDDALGRFAEAAATSDVALFYYAGHAFSVGGENFLVPTDLQPATAEEIVAQTVPLADVITALEQAPGIRMVLLDACRDNPLGLESPGGIGGGLARVGTGADFFISYATQPGAVAFDGDGRNGTFTEALLSHIHTPAQSLTDMMIAVRRDVIAASGGQQIPWENSSLTRQFAFREGVPAASPETLLYQVAARTGDPNLMALYVERYPGGAHARDVLALLNEPDAAAPTLRRSLTETDPEGDQLWLLAQRTRLRQLADYYLELYPDGRHRAAAEALAAALPAEAEMGDGRLCEELATHPRDATANTAGVPFARLEATAAQAVAACERAVDRFPDLPHYVALLARAKAAAGARDEAVALYRQAAERGDLRALVSLGLLMETGDGVPRDPQGALALYERAAEGGSADGAINLAVALFNGQVVPADPARAVALFRQAADGGSAIATYNLGVLAQDGALGEGREAEALGWFRRAAQLGEPRGFLAAAILLDEGRGVGRDAGRAADMLLRGAASDDGQALAQLTQNADAWSPETIRAVQGRLAQAGLYAGAIDGLAGPAMRAALEAWRNGGFVAEVLGS